ncbi:MAG: ATP-binding cassette domain-containing protein [Actinomycetota bacterium]|nr:ATP-binding cassette domain-containing protein [Actinomycetota bacterium]
MSSPVRPLLGPLVGRNLSRSYGEHTVLDGVDVTVSPGRRLGLLGENGAGKSTLLRLLAGVEVPDAGWVERPDDVAYLPQEPHFAPGTSIGSVLEEALAPLHEAVRDIESLGARLAAEPDLADSYAERLEWAQAHDAWDADRRADVAAGRLGLQLLDHTDDVARLSGGQRSRLALAALITRRPSAALLDEPTNHLDDDALTLLEEFLLDLPGVVVAASHDRVFLDRVCTHVLDLDPTRVGMDGHGGRTSAGGYSGYLAAKQKARVLWEEKYAAQQEQIADLRRAAAVTARQVAPNRPPRDGDRYIHHFKGARVDRTVARRVRDAERRLQVAERLQVPRPPRSLSFDRPLTGDARGRPSVWVRDLVVHGRVRVPRVDVAAGGKLLVTGPNGSGKSSLLAVLAGSLRPDRGIVEVSARRTGLLVQDVTFTHPDRGARETYDRALGADRAQWRPLHDLGLLHPRETGKPVAALSVGQRRRLALAILVAGSPELLLLDEPTNHISLALADELEQALGTAAGTVVLASHDRWLRRRWGHVRLELRG